MMEDKCKGCLHAKKDLESCHNCSRYFYYLDLYVPTPEPEPTRPAVPGKCTVATLVGETETEMPYLYSKINSIIDLLAYHDKELIELRKGEKK